VSPQFHIKFDPTFQTIREGTHQRASSWQEKCGFITQDKIESDAPHPPRDSTPRQATSGNQSFYSEEVQGTTLPIEASLQREQQEAPPVQGHRLPTEASLQREQQDAPPAAPSTRIDKTTTDEQHDLRIQKKYRVQLCQTKPAFRRSSKMLLLSTGQVQDSTQIDETTREVQQQLRRSTRQNKPIQRLIEAMNAELQDQPIPGEIFSFQAMFPEKQVICLLDVDPLLAFTASNDPDVMYLHEAMRQPDRRQFLKVMQQEVEGQTKNGNWSIIPRTKVPQGSTILPAVWAMRRKRRIDTREVYKWKARLNIDGSKQTKGINYWETYAPVATWPSIRFIMVHTLLHG
jgi:hypothetical protein